jgi:hypothetical protein
MSNPYFNWTHTYLTGAVITALEHQDLLASILGGFEAVNTGVVSYSAGLTANLNANNKRITNYPTTASGPTDLITQGEAFSHADLAVQALVGTAIPDPNLAALRLERNTSALNTVTRNASGQLTSFTEVIAGANRISTLTYNTDGTVNTVALVINGKTRTETYSYTLGLISGMTAVET